MKNELKNMYETVRNTIDSIVARYLVMWVTLFRANILLVIFYILIAINAKPAFG